MIPAHRSAAIILAAGYSRRMGRFKPLLPLGNRPMIDWSIALFRSSGLSQIHVVVGHRREELTGLLKNRNVAVAINPDFDRGMFSSVKAGIRTLDSKCRAFFILPADIPLVRPATIRRLLECFDPARTDIAIPSFAGRPGHPPLIARNLVPLILESEVAGGLQATLKLWQGTPLDVPVPDRHILNDADCPDDFQALEAARPRHGIPDPEECRAVLASNGPDAERIGRHGWQVARVADTLTAALRRAGLELDADLIRAAALIHDLAKGTPNHARVGAAQLRALGFVPVAEIVACHHDIRIDPQAPVSAAEVVYLADKLVSGDRIVSLEQRFAAALERYGAVTEARVNIRRRRDQALAVQARIEAVIGCPLATLLDTSGQKEMKS